MSFIVNVTPNVGNTFEVEVIVNDDLKKYADEAKQSANDAEQSASEALISEQSASSSANSAQSFAMSASGSATSASVSASTATTQAGIATTKANEASQSASNALASEQASAQSEANALASEQNALASEQSAGQSAQTATTKANEASSYASSASQSASNALASEQSALASKNSATASASTATTQAGIATTKASEASQSASNALASEQSSSSSAFTATTQASIATTQAEIATTQAGIATTQAGIATTKASEASQSESNALTSANNASSSASTATTQAGIATTQAGIATTQASNALTSANNAAASAAAAAQVGTSTLLTGFSVGANTAIAATDSILQAFNKTQGQINARVSTNLYSANGTLAGNRTITLGGFSLDFIGTATSRFFANGRLGLGTTTDGGFLLDVNGTARITPPANSTGLTLSSYSLTSANDQPAIDITGTWNTTGTPTLIRANVTNTASNASSLLMDLQVGGVSSFRITRDGSTRSRQAIYVGPNAVAGTAGLVAVNPLDGTTTIPSNINYGIRLSDFRDVSSAGYSYYISSFQYVNLTYTSGDGGYVSIERSFAPTSGTGTFTVMRLTNTINQTGGANGITRGLHVNPTLTSAADWRSIEWSNNTGRGIWGVGTADNAVAGNLHVGSATVANAVAQLEVSSTTKGFLPPRMTTAQRDLIVAVAGLVIYNTSTNKHQGHNGTTWNDFY